MERMLQQIKLLRTQQKPLMCSCNVNGLAVTTTEASTSTSRARKEPDLNFNIMVATGYQVGRVDHTEVINTDTFTSCPNVPIPYPFTVGYAVAMKQDSKMVICGGYPRSSDCYSYSNDKWNIKVFRLEPPRSGAMSVEIRPGEWLIMGGYDGTNYLTDTKILKKGIFIQGPDLPLPIHGGSTVMLNETHLFVAAGQYQASFPYYSPRNYLLDINTNKWTRIVDRTLSPYHFHASGLFYNSDAGEIQVANLGRYGLEVYSPRLDFWERKVTFPSPLTYLWRSAAIQTGTESFLLIGGRTNVEKAGGDIYRFDENGLTILRENALTVNRVHHVSMPISKHDFQCD